MKEQFVTYEIATELKELGFNEPCFGRFVGESTFILDNGELSQEQNTTTYAPLAPLWQQVIDWLREKHNIHIIIDKVCNVDNSITFWNYELCYVNKDDIIMDDKCRGLRLYEEARKQAILKAIELIKTRQK